MKKQYNNLMSFLSLSLAISIQTNTILGMQTKEIQFSFFIMNSSSGKLAYTFKPTQYGEDKILKQIGLTECNYQCFWNLHNSLNRATPTLKNEPNNDRAAFEAFKKKWKDQFNRVELQTEKGNSTDGSPNDLLNSYHIARFIRENNFENQVFMQPETNLNELTTTDQPIHEIVSPLYEQMNGLKDLNSEACLKAIAQNFIQGNWIYFLVDTQEEQGNGHIILVATKLNSPHFQIVKPNHVLVHVFDSLMHTQIEATQFFRQKKIPFIADKFGKFFEKFIRCYSQHRPLDIEKTTIQEPSAANSTTTSAASTAETPSRINPSTINSPTDENDKTEFQAKRSKLGNEATDSAN